MHGLAAIDLNLVLVLHALLEERSVTRAARRVGLSQPAMSHALTRLRDHFGDPLLVRSGRVMLATPRAESLREPVRAAVDQLAVALVQQRFDPERLDTTFRIVADDYVEHVLLPRVLGRLRDAAPRLDVEVLPRGAPGRKALLRSGAADLAVGFFSGAGMDLHRERLFDERWRCVVRADHPLAKRRRTMKTWIEWPHVVIAPTGGRRGAIDRILEEAGLERRVGLTVPHFLAAFPILARTDFVLSVAERLAVSLAPLYGLTTFRPPVSIPPYEIAMLWHPRTHHDPAQQWLREVIATTAARV